MPVLYTDYFTKRYTMKWYSASAFITYIFYLMAVVLALILVIRTHSKKAVFMIIVDFWVTSLTTYD